MKTPIVKIQALVFFLAMLFVTGPAFAQLPNNSFENWSGSSLDGWTFTYAEPGYENVFKSTDASQGNYAVSLKPVFNNSQGNVPRAAINSGMFPLTTAYTSLRGDIKGLLAGGDDFVITVDLFDGGTTLAVGSYSTGQSATEWSSFSAPINYGYTGIPDSAWINVLVTNGTTATEGTHFLVDNLRFEGASATNHRPEPSGLTLFPNPAIDRLTLHFTLSQPDRFTFHILDLSGQLLSTIKSHPLQPGPNYITLSTTGLTPGLYFLQASGEHFGFIQKVMVGM